MKQELVIAEILRNKPQGIKLYSPIFGNCTFCYIKDESSDICVRRPYNEMSYFNFDGVYHTGGECLLFPSKEMQDWSKFAWKKGDVLVNENNAHIIFEKFSNDTYTTFIGKYYCDGDDESGYSYISGRYTACTQQFHIEKGDAIQTYISNIEKEIGGKLNLETLVVDKPQPGFKDEDVVCISGIGYLAYGIVKSIDNSSKKLEYYVLNDMSALKFEDWLSFEDKHIQPITETQRMILFDALAKEGKYWDAEKKQVIDVKLEIKLQPFDKVLVRDSEDREWRISLFGYKDNSYYYCINGYSWKQCIPYEGNEHLLGTKNNPK